MVKPCKCHILQASAALLTLFQSPRQSVPQCAYATGLRKPVRRNSANSESLRRVYIYRQPPVDLEADCHIESAMAVKVKERPWHTQPLSFQRQDLGRN